MSTDIDFIKLLLTIVGGLLFTIMALIDIYEIFHKLLCKLAWRN